MMRKKVRKIQFPEFVVQFVELVQVEVLVGEVIEVPHVYGEHHVKTIK